MLQQIQERSVQLLETIVETWLVWDPSEEAQGLCKRRWSRWYQQLSRGGSVRLHRETKAAQFRPHRHWSVLQPAGAWASIRETKWRRIKPTGSRQDSWRPGTRRQSMTAFTPHLRATCMLSTIVPLRFLPSWCKSSSRSRQPLREYLAKNY
jgi:hypothetical protein